MCPHGQRYFHLRSSCPCEHRRLRQKCRDDCPSGIRKQSQTVLFPVLTPSKGVVLEPLYTRGEGGSRGRGYVCPDTPWWNRRGEDVTGVGQDL